MTTQTRRSTTVQISVQHYSAKEFTLGDVREFLNECEAAGLPDETAVAHSETVLGHFDGLIANYLKTSDLPETLTPEVPV